MEENILLKLDIDVNKSLRGISSLIQQNKELAKFLRDAPKQGEKGFEELNDDLKKASELFAKNRKEILEFNRDLREVEVAADSMIGLSRTLRTLEGEYKLLGKAAREGIDGQRQADEILKIRTELKGLEKDLGDNRRDVGNYQEAIENAFGSNSPLANAIIQIRDFGASAALGLGVGIAIEGLQSLGTAAVEATQKFIELRGAIQTVSGLRGFDLDNAAVQVQTIADVFGAATDDIILSAQALQRRDDVDGLGDALQIIEDGFLGGADAGKEFLTTLQDQSARFADVTDSTETYINLINETARLGIDNDRLIDTLNEADDALKEFGQSQVDALAPLGDTFVNDLSKRIREGSVDTIEVIQEIAEQAKKVGLDFQQLQLVTADVFKGAGEDAGGFGVIVEGVINATNKSIKDYVDSTNELTVSQQRQIEIQTALNEQQNEWSRNTARLTDSTNNLWTQLQTVGFESLNGIAVAIANIRAVFSGVIEVFRQGSGIITDFFTEAAIRADIGVKQLRAKFARGENKLRLQDEIIDARLDLSRLENDGASIAGAFAEGYNREANRQVESLGRNLENITKNSGKTVGENLIDGIVDGAKERGDIIADEIEKILIDASSLGSVFDRLQVSAEAQNSIKSTTEEIRKLLEVIRSGGVLLEESLSEQSLQGIDRIKKQLEESAQLRTDAANAELEEREAIQQFAINSARQLADTIFDIRTQAIDRQLDRELEALERRTERDLELVEDNAELTRQVNERADREREELEREAFERTKRLSIAQAAISGALAILSTLAAVPGPIDILSLGTVRVLQIAAIALTTGLQVAAIASQQFADGGMVDWGEDSHAKGGSKARVRRGNQVRNIEMHKGESMFVLSEKSTKNARQILSDRSQMYNGKRFPGTSILTNDRRRQIMAMDELIYKGTTGKPFVNVKYPTPPTYQNGGEVGLSGKGETINVMMSDAQVERMATATATAIKDIDIVNIVSDELARRELLANEQTV